jgi:Icc-related predicted phosphoesterase
MQIISEFIDESTIFISHGPAYGENDLLYNNFDGSRVRIGSKALAKLLNDKKPRYHLYGHYHQKYGIRKNSINGSYPISKKFILIDYESKKTKWLK